MEHLQVPRRGLIGPWSHRYPHQGPRQALRWWDRRLKDEPNGVEDEPMVWPGGDGESDDGKTRTNALRVSCESRDRRIPRGHV